MSSSAADDSFYDKFGAILSEPLKDKKDAQSLYEQGNSYYERGRDGSGEFSKAVECYAEATAQGHEKAQFALAWCYLRGHGVVRDIGKAAELLVPLAGKDDLARRQLFYICGELALDDANPEIRRKVHQAMTRPVAVRETAVNDAHNWG